MSFDMREEKTEEQHTYCPGSHGRNLLQDFVSILCLCFVIFSPDLVSAQGNIHIGQLRIHPFFSVTDTFSDNIYFTSTDAKRDSYVTYMPGIKLELPRGQHKAEVQYYSLATRYKTFQGEDTTDHTAKGMVNLKLGRLFEARFSDAFVKGHEGRSASATGFVQTFRNNTASASLIYQLMNRSKVEFGFSRSTWDFIQSESEFRNRDENLFSGYLYYRFLPKTSAFIEIDQKKIEYEFSTLLDNIVNTHQFGLTWEISENSRGTIKGGLLKKDFESPLLQDYSGSTGSIDFQHRFSRYASLTVLGERTINETKLQNTRYFITTGAYGEFTFRVFSKLAATARGSYGKDEFSDPVPPREDRTRMGGAALKYSIRDWLEIEGGYSNRKRTSNFPGNDYIEHSYTVSTSAIF